MSTGASTEKQAGARIGVRTILRSAIWSFKNTHNIPVHVQRAVSRIFVCRTSRLGKHTHTCSEGHRQTRWNSCRHRSCPDCCQPTKYKWLAGVEALLLAVPHSHVIFTIPDLLHALWLANPTAMEALLFKTVKLTIRTLAADPKHIGGVPGVIAVIHTWGRSLALHPHIHCILTCGGVDASGNWIRAGNLKRVFPPFVIRDLFKKKLLALVRRELKKGRLTLPADCNDQQMRQLISDAYDKKWSIFVGPAGTGIDAVINYLARYVCGGPIGNSRILSRTSSTVTFKFKNYRLKDERGFPKEQPLTLTQEEFVRRWSLHVPKPYSKRVRRFGIYSSAFKGEVKTPRYTSLVNPEGEATRSQKVTNEIKCPICGKPMILTELTRGNRERPPPLGLAA